MANCNYVNSGFVFTPVNVVTHEKEMKFNEAHMRTYAIWDAINLWKRRFKCLQTLLNHKEGRRLIHLAWPNANIINSRFDLIFISDTIQSIICACATLHNLAIQRNEQLPLDEINSPIKEIQGKEGANPRYTNMAYAQEPMALIERDNFIERHFS